MNLTVIKYAASRTMHIAAKKIAKHSPEILIGTGIAAFVGSTVTACKSTLKCEEILDAHQEEMSKVSECREMANRKEAVYTEEEELRDKAIIYAKTAGRMFKLYWKSILLGLIGIGSILAGFKIISGRYIGAVALADATKRSFDKYRENIAAEYGADADMKALTGLQRKEIEVEKEDGTKEKRDIYEQTGANVDLYSMLFDEETSIEWRDCAFLNRQFLLGKERELDDEMCRKGFVSLAEAWDRLGMTSFIRNNSPELWKEGTRKGWVYGKCNENHVSFGLIDVYDKDVVKRKTKEDFLKGLNPNVLLSFNIDGDIYQLL